MKMICGACGWPNVLLPSLPTRRRCDAAVGTASVDIVVVIAVSLCTTFTFSHLMFIFFIRTGNFFWQVYNKLCL